MKEEGVELLVDHEWLGRRSRIRRDGDGVVGRMGVIRGCMGEGVWEGMV